MIIFYPAWQLALDIRFWYPVKRLSVASLVFFPKITLLTCRMKQEVTDLVVVATEAIKRFLPVINRNEKHVKNIKMLSYFPQIEDTSVLSNNFTQWKRFQINFIYA